MSPLQNLHKRLELLHLIYLGDPSTVPTTLGGTPKYERTGWKMSILFDFQIMDVYTFDCISKTLTSRCRLNRQMLSKTILLFLLATTQNLLMDRTEESLFLVQTQ